MFRRLFNTDEKFQLLVANKTVFVQVGGVNEVIAISERLSDWIYASTMSRKSNPSRSVSIHATQGVLTICWTMTDEDAQAMQAA